MFQSSDKSEQNVDQMKEGQEKVTLEKSFVNEVAGQLELEAFKSKKNIYMYKRQMVSGIISLDLNSTFCSSYIPV